MIPMRTMKVKETGPTPRRLKSAVTAANKESWDDAGTAWHAERRDLRFTDRHARLARYGRRQGEGLPPNSREYFISYTGRKERIFGHTLKLVFSGDTRRRMRIARISATSKGVRIAYGGARNLNLRGRGQRVRPNEEFRRMTAEDERFVVGVKDKSLETELQNDTIRGEVSLK